MNKIFINPFASLCKKTDISNKGFPITNAATAGELPGELNIAETEAADIFLNEKRAEELNVSVECRQFNSEGAIVDCLQKAPERFNGIIINAGALSHYSYTLRSTIGATLLPCVEVFISNVYAGEEEFRNKSVIAPVCVGVISGFGKKSYLLALDALANLT